MEEFTHPDYKTAMEKVLANAIEAAKEIQKQVDKRFPKSFQVFKYYHYADEEHEERTGEIVFIKHTHKIDWSFSGSYVFHISKTNTEILNEIMKDYKAGSIQISLKDKGSVCEEIYSFEKEYDA